MNKKNIYLTTSALILFACTPPNSILDYDRSVAAAADAIPAEKQAAYFACQFVRHTASCQENIWHTHPNPHLSRPLTQETVKDFLSAVELRGAGRVIDRQGKKCGLPQKIDQSIWHAGYDITCADGSVWNVTRNDNQWRIVKAPAE